MGILIQPKSWLMKPPVGTQINFGHPLAKGLVGCWLFNEFGGKLVSNGLFRNHGTLSGATLPSWSTGPTGPALTFDGSSSYVDVGSDSVLGLTGPMTIQVFLSRPSSPSARGYIVASSDGTIFAWSIALNWNNPGEWAFAHGTPYDVPINTNLLSANIWYRLAIVRSGSSGSWTFTFYQNGISDKVSTGTGGTALSSKPTAFGRLGSSTQYSAATVSDVMLWNRALTATEIQWLHIEPYAFVQPPRPFIPIQVPLAEGYIFHYHR